MAHITDKQCPAGVCETCSQDGGGDSMSPAAVEIKTLQIDGRDIGARADQTILEVARRMGSTYPRFATWTVSAMWALAASAWWK